MYTAIPDETDPLIIHEKTEEEFSEHKGNFFANASYVGVRLALLVGVVLLVFTASGGTNHLRSESGAVNQQQEVAQTNNGGFFQAFSVESAAGVNNEPDVGSTDSMPDKGIYGLFQAALSQQPPAVPGKIDLPNSDSESKGASSIPRSDTSPPSGPSGAASNAASSSPKGGSSQSANSQGQGQQGQGGGSQGQGPSNQGQGPSNQGQGPSNQGQGAISRDPPSGPSNLRGQGKSEDDRSADSVGERQASKDDRKDGPKPSPEPKAETGNAGNGNDNPTDPPAGNGNGFIDTIKGIFGQYYYAPSYGYYSAPTTAGYNQYGYYQPSMGTTTGAVPYVPPATVANAGYAGYTTTGGYAGYQPPQRK